MSEAIPTVCLLGERITAIPPSSASRFRMLMTKWEGSLSPMHPSYYLRAWSIRTLRPTVQAMEEGKETYVMAKGVMLDDNEILDDLMEVELTFTHDEGKDGEEDESMGEGEGTIMDDQSQESQPRGGAKGARGADASIRCQTMMAWAHKQLINAMPGLDGRVIKGRA